MSLRIVIVCALCLMALSIASAESVTMPLKSIKKPASDLIAGSGQAIDVGQAAAMAGQGADLSLYNPADNKMWQNRSYPATEEVVGAFPDGNSGVKFLSEEAAIRKAFTYMSRVQSVSEPGKYYRFSLSRYSHTALMRAALLRKLGYFVESPKYYKNLRVFFANEEEKTTFLSNAEQYMIVDLASRNWVIENNTQNHSLVFSDAVLEPASDEYFDIHWGMAPDPNFPEQLPAVQRFSRYRAYRALILPFALVDVPESINRFSPKLGSVLSGNVVLTHPSAESFASCTYEDARWLMRRMQTLRAQDFADIVKAGAFPPELEPLVLAKLYYRAANGLELFNLQNTANWPKPSLDISSSSGLVQHGKVMREFAPGYPQRFAHGDRQSPFQDGDLGRYLSIRGKTSVLETAINNINERLNFLSTSDLANKRGQQIQQRIIDHIRTNPREPLYQPVEAWGGPVGGLSMQAGRQVTTGTYYGSAAAIQLVDNLSVSANIGYFMALDGVPKISPVGGANLVVTRDYTHVRPLLSIQEGTKVPWQNLVIPRFMGKLAGVLAEEDPKVGDGAVKVPGDGSKPTKIPLDAFLSDLREGEVFTITDSVALAAYAQVSASIDTLMGITPLDFMNTVTLGVDGSRAILRQTSFMRTSEGVQVYVRAQSANAFGLSLDVNYFINLLRVRAQTTLTDLHTDAFIIDYKPEMAEQLDLTQTDNKYVKEFLNTRASLKPTLRALFTQNDPELLYTKFKYQKFEIDHDLKTKEIRTRVLARRVDSLNEDHLLKIRYPRSLDAPDLDPKDEEVVLFSNKRGELVGRDLLGFAMDWISGILNRWAPQGRISLANNDDPNPANTPYGKAYWRTATTESDLSLNQKQYPSVAVLQHVWGGWHLNRKSFMRLLDEVQVQFKGTPIANYRLIEPEAFSNVTSVDFYRITANLSVLPGGLDRIRDLIVQPDANGKPVSRQRWLGGVFQRLSEKMGNPARANDREMFDDLMRIFGNGDYKAGLATFNTMCKESKAQSRQGGKHGEDFPEQSTGAWENGTYYDCLLPWVKKLLEYSANFPKDKKAQTKWLTNVLYILDEQIPLPQLLKFLGEENYIFFVRINGFRTGDEDGDIEYFSNSLGDPKKNIEYANGLINMFATKTRISPIEMDRTQGGFK
ncbi:hypothetical protein [Bdellovibrio svalbardensis]|uniref:Uncharacterized protein n=1 Tax=Bdellovibrio svalbardensis TaxID=2972972 RepID=A0ABT6DIT0_9BACT|nr:hypothetical protein [Bdellovibrio svalbardensis]MDG0816140.1 hypothetical protein [Bdellovibrio svalbardensis]